MATSDPKKAAANEAAKKALEAVNAKKAAEKKKVEHTYTQVGQQTTGAEELVSVMKGNALPYRIGAFIFWALALGCEVLAILVMFHKVDFGNFTKQVIVSADTIQNPVGWYIVWIGALVLDLIFLIIGSQLWKKANHLSPASKKNKLAFWLQNNLGVIVAAFAFIPFIILALLNKDADKKTKIIAVAVAAVALLIGGLTSYDWNPVSQEEVLEAAGVGGTVYWTEKGTVYHSYDDCGSLNHTVNLLTGTITAAVESGKTRLCYFCENRAQKESGLVDADERVTLPEDEIEVNGAAD